jgi:hypothetical protein
VGIKCLGPLFVRLELDGISAHTDGGNIALSSTYVETHNRQSRDRMHVTVTNLFPDVVIRSCRFHLGQAWWRTIQALGLAKEYKKNVTDISKWLHHFFGLALNSA